MGYDLDAVKVLFLEGQGVERFVQNKNKIKLQSFKRYMHNNYDAVETLLCSYQGCHIYMSSSAEFLPRAKNMCMHNKESGEGKRVNYLKIKISPQPHPQKTPKYELDSINIKARLISLRNIMS